MSTPKDDPPSLYLRSRTFKSNVVTFRFPCARHPVPQTRGKCREEERGGGEKSNGFTG